MNKVLSEPTEQPAAQFPELVQARLDPEQLRRLFEDYRNAAAVRSIRARAADRSRADEALTSLDGASEVLRSGGAMQIRYEFQGAQWCDTLTGTAEGVRLVRMQLAAD